MKYKLLFLALFSSLFAQAQMKQSMLVFGPKAGLQINDLAIINNPSKLKSKLNLQYQVGLFGRFNYKRFSLQPELIYQTKGGNLILEPVQKHTYRYVSMPVLLGISPLKGLYLEAGPEFSWALNEGWKKNGIQQFGPNTKNTTALVAGARFDLLDVFSPFSLNLRYTYGLNNTNQQAAVENQILDLRSRTIQVSVSYNFSEYYKWWKKYGIKKR